MNDFGPLEPLLADPDIIEIMINRYDQIFVERHGVVEAAASGFRDNAHLLDWIQTMLVQPAGQVLDEAHPLLDLRFGDGSRCFVVIPPVAQHGPVVVIRKLPRLLTAQELIEYGALSAAMLDFIRMAVVARLNIAVAGGTGAGKTTVLNIVSGFIPPTERIVGINGDFELQLPQPHQVLLNTRPANNEGKGEISAAELVRSAMKMRPDRIVVGEVFGSEMALVLQALTSGYDGSLFSLHATSIRDALARIEIMATQGSPQTPLLSLRHQIASGIQLILCQQRLPDGRRKLTHISEVTGLEEGVIVVNDIFRWEQTGVEDGVIRGEFRPTGYIPHCLETLRNAGFDVAEDFFRA